MQRSQARFVGVLCAAAVAWVALLPLRSTSVRAQAQEPIAVVVSSESAIKEIGLGALRSAFLNLPTTLEGERLIPLNLPPNSPVRMRFDRAVLGLGPDQVGRFWVDQRVRDGRQAPRAVPSTDLAMRVAANLKGAVVYMPHGLVRSARLRVLRVDGKLPGDPNYVLR